MVVMVMMMASMLAMTKLRRGHQSLAVVSTTATIFIRLNAIASPF